MASSLGGRLLTGGAASDSIFASTPSLPTNRPSSFFLFGSKQSDLKDPFNDDRPRYSPTASGTWGFQIADHPYNNRQTSVLKQRIMYSPDNPAGGRIKSTLDVDMEYNTVRSNCRPEQRGSFARLFGFPEKCIPLEEEPANYNVEFSRHMHNSMPLPLAIAVGALTPNHTSLDLACETDSCSRARERFAKQRNHIEFLR
eukprot:TRINITY_DN24762_c0_g1_i1.p1 TRINITY_DN24762_c0_g1~~TRINITY_DN24762_c0_g1_i1.p1  ORF type:complete len:199 (-),score=17.34 TRINITY_DN24762_c0_g1_i1:360-956(-)